MVSDKQLNSNTAYLVDGWCLGMHHHPLSDWGSAGGRQTTHVLNLYHTEAATPVGFQVRVVTEGRNIDSSRLSRL